MTKAAPLAIISSLSVILGCALLGATEARADYFVFIDQEGPDVVATGSGSINTSGLGPISGGGFNENATIQSANGRVQVGAGIIQFWNNVAFTSGPTGFGSDTVQTVTLDSGGQPTGMDFSDHLLDVPEGYVSNTQLSGTATWPGRTLASLGLTNGTSDTWTWGSGDTLGRFTITVVPGPVVGAGLPGLIAALGGLVAMARRRRKQLA